MEERKKHCIVLAVVLHLVVGCVTGALDSWGDAGYVSGVGDPGMKRDGLRLAIESWNQCNEVGDETPNMGSPRAADCFDVYKCDGLINGELRDHLCLLQFSFLLLQYLLFWSVLQFFSSCIFLRMRLCI